MRIIRIMILVFLLFLFLLLILSDDYYCYYLMLWRSGNREIHYHDDIPIRVCVCVCSQSLWWEHLELDHQIDFSPRVYSVIVLVSQVRAK